MHDKETLREANHNLWNKAKEYGREEGRREILGELQELLASLWQTTTHIQVIPTVRIQELIERNTPPRKGGE